MARYLIVEPEIQGHHYTYLENIALGLVERGHEVIVGIANGDVGRNIKERLTRATAPKMITFCEGELARNHLNQTGFLGLALAEYRYWAFFAKIYALASRSEKIDEVIVPYGDYMFYAMSFLGSPFKATSCVIITMRQRFHLRETVLSSIKYSFVWIRRQQFQRILAFPTVRKVVIIDPALLEFANLEIMRHRQKIEYISDPIRPYSTFEKYKAKSQLRIENNAEIVLMFGSIVKRKGIQDLLRLLAKNNGEKKLVGLIVGAIGEDARETMESELAVTLIQEKRLLVLNGYADEYLEDMAYCASDYVWLGYVGFDLMSGVLAKSARMRKSVFHRNSGLIGRYARLYGSSPLPRGTSISNESLTEIGVYHSSFDSERNDTCSVPDHSWRHALEGILSN